MFIPTADDDISILINSKFDFLHVTCLDVVLLNKDKLLTVPVKFCHAGITLDMDMNRLMLFAVKKNEKPKKRNTSGIYNCYYIVTGTKVGIIFNTINFLFVF